MGDERLVITEAGFFREFLNQHTNRPERPFCFILGAGASRSSGILTGGEMAKVLLRELHEAANFDDLSLEEWATPERVGINEFRIDDLARFYPQLYQRRYGDDEQGGIAFLESEMDGKEPSYGYSVSANLVRYAQFLEQERADYDKAERYYERALEANPKEPSVLVPYADFLNRKRNDSDKAEKYFTRAIEIDPNNHPALTSYAHLLHKAGRDLDKAEELYARAIKAEPKDPYALERFAEFLRDIRGDYEKAEQFQTRARFIRRMIL